jgi:hypothetical protein
VVAVAAQAPPQVGPQVAAQEPGDPEPVVLGDVLELVPQQTLVALAAASDDHEPPDGDAGRARWHRPADPQPPPVAALDRHEGAA